MKTRPVTLHQACQQAGISETTLWRLRQRHEDIDVMVQDAKRYQSQIRVEKVENALFKKIIDGKAAAAETIFWLKNRAPHRWRDRQEHQIIDDREAEHEATDEFIRRFGSKDNPEDQ